ncbi:Cytochrome bd-I ubiquinol oxidase subunit 2 [Aquicella siphonis]|uniref:Cytochrome bd-I ubiquinol oxidase subunit 2 n=1 Tax=Aquicella siphonis TaxID=254247 RepID=A0A5E4PI35_9COXI|nr:cytochrome d ubiquinol oxidase subunit II [Aquicella siphonis]VVC76053.1 Cytochrome bd-I ubiquinol oxidase subunit 2 [Aquicella siphonis]
MLDFEMLRVIWWLLLGILFMGFAVTDGFDLGAATLLPLVSRDDTERRIVLNTIGPVWEGNQVWIILGAGAIFAAWPYVYAVAFSGAYLPVLLLLLSMGISRPVSFKYRSKLPNLFWRRTWDWVVFFGGVVPSILFGVLVGNILQGLPYFFDDTLRISYSGSVIDLLNPFALWCGITSLAMLTMHGGLYLAVKTENPVRDRAIFWSRVSAFLLILFFAAGGIWVANALNGYLVVSGANPYGYSNPLHKQVIAETGAWLKNYSLYPLSMIVPALGFAGALGALTTARWGNSRFAFFCSSISMIGIIGTVGVSMFPFILPSSSNMTSSLLVWDASSSQLTLLLMLAAVVIFLPIVLIYTAWVYRVLRGKVRRDTIEKDERHNIAY